MNGEIFGEISNTQNSVAKDNHRASNVQHYRGHNNGFAEKASIVLHVNK